MTFTWTYYTYDSKTGLLADEDGYPQVDWPYFASAADAEAWLVAHDIRGTVI